jgi:hypothetical protein
MSAARRRDKLTGRSVPPGAVSSAATRTLVALLSVHQRDGRATVRSVGEEAGHASTGTTHEQLHHLRNLDLLTWDEGRAGTLRPLVRVVG